MAKALRPTHRTKVRTVEVQSGRCSPSPALPHTPAQVADEPKSGDSHRFVTRGAARVAVGSYRVSRRWKETKRWIGSGSGSDFC